MSSKQADLDAGREWMRRAWHELNAIRARDGAPVGVSEEYWSELTDKLGELLGDDAKPWMLGAAKALTDPLSAAHAATERDACMWSERAERAEKRVLELQEIGGNQGARIGRMLIALRLARAWGIRAQGYDGEVAGMLANWITRAEWEPLPWPDSPFVRQWLAERGYENVDGKIGMRFTVRYSPIEQAP